MQHGIDWQAIKADYEQAVTLRTLVAKYDVPKTTIIRHAQAEGWQRTTDRTIMVQGPDHPLEPQQPPAVETVTLAREMVSQLATIAHAETCLALKEHKLFADALSQYNKIMVTAPVNAELPKGIDFSIFDTAELEILYPIFARAEARAREREKDGTIIPIRRDA